MERPTSELWAFRCPGCGSIAVFRQPEPTKIPLSLLRKIQARLDAAGDIDSEDWRPS